MLQDTDSVNHPAILTVVRLPGRLNVAETAKLLGFSEHDIPILIAARRLTPLGEPAANAPKWFATSDIMEFASDRDWLSKATKEVSKYWRNKRERRASGRRLPNRPSSQVPLLPVNLPT